MAIARALINEPKIIIADEPTADLDDDTTKQVMELFTGLNSEGMTVVMITHDPEIAEYASRKVLIRDGILTENSLGGVSNE